MTGPIPRARAFLGEACGAVSTEWVAVTAVLMVATIGLAYALFSGGLGEIQSQTNSDLNRVNTGAPAPGG